MDEIRPRGLCHKVVVEQKTNTAGTHSFRGTLTGTPLRGSHVQSGHRRTDSYLCGAGVRDRRCDPPAFRAGDHRRRGRPPRAVPACRCATPGGGWAALAAIVNYSLQAAALAWGSVVMVTALQVTALLFALPIYARLTHRRVTRWEWIVGGRAGRCAGGGHHRRRPGDRATSGGRCTPGSSWPLVMGPTLVLCVLGARIWSGRPAAAVLLAVVAGSSLALFAVLTKGIVEVAEDGLGAVAAVAGVLSLAAGGPGGDDLPAVGLPRRCADRLVADDDRGQAGGRRCARDHRAGRDVRRRRARRCLC